jgi:phosphosulfolactate phosphohydrolase-like enzyme
VCFVPARSGDEELTLDATWACGMLIRVLLEELERDSTLTDGAGLAVMVAKGAEDAAAQLSSGVRWRRHLERGGHVDDLRVASAVDSIGIVPAISFEGDAIIARPWLPAP